MASSNMLTDDDIGRMLLERSEPDLEYDDFEHEEVVYENASYASEPEEDHLSNDEYDESSDTDMSAESDVETPQQVGPFILGKDGHRWNCHAPDRRGRRSAENIVTHLPCVRGAASTARYAYQSWKLLLNEAMISEIFLRTNEEITKRKIYNVNPTFRLTDEYELLNLFGLYYAAGVLKSSKLNLDDLWSPDFGMDLFRASMSKRRFQFLTSCLRFDDKSTRPERKQTDRFAPIRDIWEAFVSNSKSLYSPHEYLTLDEQLVSFRGRCSFRTYMPKKPDKYGMKIVMLNDAKTFYMLNAEPYVGPVKKRPDELVPEYYVRTMTEPVHQTGRNITYDNWFGTVPMADKMIKDYKLTTICTLKKNKAQIPPVCLSKREAGSSLFFFDGKKTLVSYTQKKKKTK